VRIIAHSMGGLVARALELKSPATWSRMMEHPEARVLMLGTPNGGSWAPMQVLSGDDNFGNTLIAFGAPFQDHSARQMMAQFPGFLQLQAGLLDEASGLKRKETWLQLANDDLERVRQYNWWHTDERQLIPYRWGVPEQAVLDQAVALRQKFDAQLRDWLPKFKDRLLLVVGRAPFTPEGFEVGDEGLTYLNAVGTGDGRVALKSALLPGVKTWQLDSVHGKLPEAAEAFDAYLDLLQSGTTSRLPPHLETTRSSATAAAEKVAYTRIRLARQPMGVSVPGNEDAVTQLPAPPASIESATDLVPLEITVLNGDLRFVRGPLLVGHYRSSVLVGSEYVVNQLIGGTMEQSLAMGQYPNEPKTHQLFVNRVGGSNGLDPMPRPEAVVVVGLGEEGKLDAACLVASVTRGVLAFAQRRMEHPDGPPPHFELAATLLGSGGVGIGPGQAAQLIAQGVREANLAIRDNNRRRDFMLEQRRHSANPSGMVDEPAWPFVSRLHLVERYLDRAAEAWRALRVHGDESSSDFKVGDSVETGAGALRRTLEGGYRGSNYDLISAVSSEDAAGEKKILYTIDTKRARSEVRAQSTQLRLVRDLVGRASTDQESDAQIGSTLFRLLVPLELEAFLGGSSETRLELDRGTAGIPWEMLDTGSGSVVGAGGGNGGSLPWAIRTRLLRRLRVDEFRQRVADAGTDAHVLVIGEPRTDPIYPRLPGARREAAAVADLLTAEGVLEPDRVKRLISS